MSDRREGLIIECCFEMWPSGRPSHLGREVEQKTNSIDFYAAQLAIGLLEPVRVGAVTSHRVSGSGF